MRYAIFSDVHNEVRALTKVLHHARQQAVDGYFCLGDVGVDNCVELVRDTGVPTVFGNWEVSGWPHLSPENQQWALNLPPFRKEAGFWLTHATPLWPPHLASLAEIVIFDAPPIITVNDASLLAAKVDGVLLVVKAGGTKRDHVKAAKDRLAKVNARLVGAVLTHAQVDATLQYT